MAGKPKKIVGKNMGLGADMKFRVVGGGGKGHEQCRRIGGGLGQVCTHNKQVTRG